MNEFMGLSFFLTAKNYSVVSCFFYSHARGAPNPAQYNVTTPITALCRSDFPYHDTRLFRLWCIPRFATSFDLLLRARLRTLGPAGRRLDRSGGPLARACATSPSASSSSVSPYHAGVI